MPPNTTQKFNVPNDDTPMTDPPSGSSSSYDLFNQSKVVQHEKKTNLATSSAAVKPVLSVLIESTKQDIFDTVIKNIENEKKCNDVYLLKIHRKYTEEQCQCVSIVSGCSVAQCVRFYDISDKAKKNTAFINTGFGADLWNKTIQKVNTSLATRSPTTNSIQSEMNNSMKEFFDKSKEVNTAKISIEKLEINEFLWFVRLWELFHVPTKACKYHQSKDEYFPWELMNYVNQSNDIPPQFIEHLLSLYISQPTASTANRLSMLVGKIQMVPTITLLRIMEKLSAKATPDLKELKAIEKAIDEVLETED